MLHEIDLVLEENGIFQSDTRFCGAKMRERSGGLFLDVFATSILPFDVNRTANAVWKHYTSTQKHFGSVYEKTTQVRTVCFNANTEYLSIRACLFRDNTATERRYNH